jgi:GH18 family chitinase
MVAWTNNFVLSSYADVNNSHNKVVVCYALDGWATWYRPSNGEFLVENIDPMLFTHIIYAFVSLDMTLKGKSKEVGTYECRWNNSRGEARHRQFTVGLSFIEEKTDNKTDMNIIISVTATVIGLLLIAMGIGIKFYLDKVRYKMQI